MAKYWLKYIFIDSTIIGRCEKFVYSGWKYLNWVGTEFRVRSLSARGRVACCCLKSRRPHPHTCPALSMHWCWIKCVTFHLDWRRQFGVSPLDHCKRIVRVDIWKHTKIKANNFASFSSPLLCRVMDGSSLGSSLQPSSSGQVSGMLINSHTGSKLRNIFRVHSWHFSSSSRKERFGFFHNTLFWSGCFLESARGTHQLNS